MVTIVVAVGKDGVIGVNGKIPWHIPEELKHFRATTEGGIVVMGRKTWDSIPEKYRPLPNRMNIVVSGSYFNRDDIGPSPVGEDFDGVAVHDERDGVYYAKNLSIAVLLGRELSHRTYGCRCEPIFLIGGAQVYHDALSMDMVDNILMSQVDYGGEGDAFFPVLNPNKWMLRRVSRHASNEFYIYEYVRRKNCECNEKPIICAA